MTTDPLRSKLSRRTETNIALINHKIPTNLLKSPSQKRSESMRKKLNRGVVDPTLATVKDDCNNCPDELTCPHEHNLNICPKVSRINRCKKCGQKVRYRFVEGEVWEYCPVCRERR